MKLELLESDIKYYTKADSYGNDIKSYANDYELLTFFYNKYNIRKYINKYNSKNIKFNRKVYPIPLGIDINYLGIVEIYYVDVINFLPKGEDTAIIKIIGPGEIDEGKLILYKSIENTLNKLNNKTYTIYYYYDWDVNNKYNVNNYNFNYNIYESEIKTNKKKKDVVFIEEFSIMSKYLNDNELKSLPIRLKFIISGLNLLKTNGNLYLQYFNCSQLETLILMISLYECFNKVEFIRSDLRVNTLVGGMYIFQNYNGKKMENNFNKNIKYLSNIKSIINHEFVKYINKTQKNIYKKFNKFLKKCEVISNSRKSKKYFEDYQISVGVDWCNENNILITKYYQDKLYKDSDIKYLKKIFYPEKINYKSLKLYYDSFYSVTYYSDYLEIINVIRKYFPKEKTIIDSCANVGASTISFSYDFNNVIGIEIEENRYNLLKNNVNVYKRKNIELINDDYLNIENKYKNNLVFFDPPWSGIYYKIEDNIELYLGDTNIKEVLRNKSVMKAPYNFNYSDLKDIIVERLRSFILIIKI